MTLFESMRRKALQTYVGYSIAIMNQHGNGQVGVLTCEKSIVMDNCHRVRYENITRIHLVNSITHSYNVKRTIYDRV